MTCERVDIGVLVVDEDDTSLAILATILTSLGYNVLTAKGAMNALEILREFQGFIDLLITELHITGMNGFEFQKCVQNNYHIPVIIMSADARQSVISMSLTIGTAQYILKPFSADDFRDIWKHAMDAKNRKLAIANNNEGDENNSIQDVNSATSSSNVSKKKRKYCPKKNSQENKERESGEGSQLVKKPKVVWTGYLHNLFQLAIRQIGLDKAVPKTILQLMGVPNLTRENVASHLQKYRIFLRKVAGKGVAEGLSGRDLRSRFAAGLSASMIRDFQEQAAKARDPVQQYMRGIAHQSGYGGIANAVKHNNVSTSTNYSTNTPLGRFNQFPYPYHNGSNMMLQNQQGSSLNQAILGVQSSLGSNAEANNIQQNMLGSNVGANNMQQNMLGSNVGANNMQQNMLGSYSGGNNMQQNMLGSYANQPFYAQSSYNNARAVFPSDGVMGHSLMTSANGLTGGVNYGDNQLMYPNYGSLGNNNKNFSYGQGNWNMGSLNNSNNSILPWTSTSTYNPNCNIQLNGGSQMVGNGIQGGLINNTIGITDSVANKNSFGLINDTTQNANNNVTPLGQGKFGFASASASTSTSTSNAVEDWSSGVPATLITNNGTQVAENIPANPELPQQLHDNVAENHIGTSIGEGTVNQEDDLSDLFMMINDMPDLFELEKNPITNDILKSDFSSFDNAMQNQHIAVRTSSLPEETPASNNNSDQMEGDYGFAEMEPLDSFMTNDVASAINSAIDQDWDFKLIEALFGNGSN